MNRYIIIKTQFEGIHNWPGCNIEEVEFLKYPHRHIFYIELKKEVMHNDRDVEIIKLKREINQWVEKQGKNLGSFSCEDIAEVLLHKFKAYSVKVLEDNENGAEITI